jgi:diguanylate cyclase (GGDEF)-like protein
MADSAMHVSREIRARHDIFAGAVTIAAILLFVGSGSQALTSFFSIVRGDGATADPALSAAVLLNIALLLFGWRRYNDLVKEVAERKAAEARANLLASCDPLTGFLNRRSLAERVATMAAAGQRIVMLMIDLDHFKTVNDVHGHMAGDKLLVACADAIRSVLPADAIAARLGGDEFACALPLDQVGEAAIEAIGFRILARLAEPFDLEGQHAHISASMGLAKGDGDQFDDIMRRADIAMYAAKKDGRNRLTWFDTSMERELKARNMIEAGLRSGIPAGEIVPYYEQQIDLVSGALIGFEVLARWEHPERGIIMPDTFIPVAEEAGLIGDLSVAVMRQAFAAARSWDPTLTLSVNISPAQLKDPWLAQKIVRLLVETGFPAQRLEVEITESSLFENLGLAQSIVRSLKNQGVRLALDDFGTGYSSLAHLRELPFDRIKIDRSFVTSMTANPESAAIVDAIARLGDSLGLPVTAEGIEHADTEERLRAIGCQKGQGWHFGKPLSSAEVHKLLADKAMLGTARAEPTAALRRRRA